MTLGFTELLLLLPPGVELARLELEVLTTSSVVVSAEVVAMEGWGKLMGGRLPNAEIKTEWRERNKKTLE